MLKEAETPKKSKKTKPVNIRTKARKENTTRRSEMDIRVIEFSIPQHKLNQAERKYMLSLFHEAAAFYNERICLSRKSLVTDYGDLVYLNNVFEMNSKSNVVEVFKPLENTYEAIILQHLSSQMKQELLTNIKNSIKGMSAKKKKGYKGGKLKFKRNVTIPLSQFGVTYKLSDNFSTVQFQGSKLKFALHRNKAFSRFLKDLGYDKKCFLPALLADGNVEFGSADLKAGLNDYKLMVTVYFNRAALAKTIAFAFQLTDAERTLLNQALVGADAGITDELTLNVGNVEESIALNSRQRMLPYAMAIKHAQSTYSKFTDKHGNKSRKAKKLKRALNLAWETYYNAKENMVSHLKGLFRQFTLVYHQDENIKSWHANKKMHYSRKIQEGILGKVYATLKELENTVMRPKMARTTKTCTCGKVNAIGLKDRIYHCPACKYTAHRDTHSSYMMIVWDDIPERLVAKTPPSPLLWDGLIPTKDVYDIILRKLGNNAVGFAVRYQSNVFSLPESGIDSWQGEIHAEFKEDNQALESLSEQSADRTLIRRKPENRKTLEAPSFRAE